MMFSRHIMSRLFAAALLTVLMIGCAGNERVAPANVQLSKEVKIPESDVVAGDFCRFSLPGDEFLSTRVIHGPYIRPEQMQGEWVGHIAGELGRDFLHVVFDCQANSTVTKLNGTGWDIRTGITVVGHQMQFDAGDLQFDGFMDESALRGVVHRDGTLRSFRLRRVRPLSEEERQAYTGSYEVSPRNDIHILRDAELNRLMLVDGNVVSAIFPTAMNEFVAVAGSDATLVLDYQGEPAQTRFGDERDQRRIGVRRDRYRIEQVRFGDGVTTWRGRLYIPAGSGERAGVLVVPNAGDWDTFVHQLHVVQFANEGAMVLQPDDEANSMEALRAGLDYLAAQTEVEASHIGVFAHGDGAARAMELAREYPERVRSIVLASAPPSLTARIMERQGYALGDEQTLLAVYGGDDPQYQEGGLPVAADDPNRLVELRSTEVRVYPEAFHDLRIAAPDHQLTMKFPEEYFRRMRFWTTINLFPLETEDE